MLDKFLLLLITFLIPALGGLWAQERPKFLKPPPPGVTEITGNGIGLNGSIVQLKDGALMLAQGHRRFLSTDGGHTWSQPRPSNCPVEVSSMVRLRSGALAALGYTGDDQYGLDWGFTTSQDDGQTWGRVSPVKLATATYPLDNSLIQLASGRLLLPGAMMLSGFDFKVGTSGGAIPGPEAPGEGSLITPRAKATNPRLELPLCITRMTRARAGTALNATEQ